MPYLSHIDFAAVHAAVGDVVHHGLSLDSNEKLIAAMALMDTAVESVASPGLRDLAHEQYGTDECEIDDEGVGTSDGSEGTFVQAWVWVSHEDQIAAGIMDDPDVEEEEA